MPLSGMVAPYGVREILLVSTDGSSSQALPAPQVLKFSEQIVTNELKGGDAVRATVTFAEAVELEFEAGGISLDAYAFMTGRTVAQEGTDPNQTATLQASAGDSFPYIKLYGKIVTDEGDLHVKFNKVKIQSIEGDFQGEEFFVTKGSLKAIADDSDVVFEFVRNQTATALPTS